ncbi:hypothetical protein KKH46_03005 [Patescibacteria group bacterium]|nr:hypothetical protein [Patescibacteria group bacterium]
MDTENTDDISIRIYSLPEQKRTCTLIHDSKKNKAELYYGNNLVVDFYKVDDIGETVRLLRQNENNIIQLINEEFPEEITLDYKVMMTEKYIFQEINRMNNSQYSAFFDNPN